LIDLINQYRYCSIHPSLDPLQSPPSEPIPFHHEMAQVPNPPKYVMFYCEVAPEKGGETPIILSNQVYNYFKETYPAVCEKVETLGVRYVRTMPEEDDVSSAIGRSWKNTFIVKTKEECEAKMREIGTEWEWLPNGDLRTGTLDVICAWFVCERRDIYYEWIIPGRVLCVSFQSFVTFSLGLGFWTLGTSKHQKFCPSD
jgi:hypothetical protein